MEFLKGVGTVIGGVFLTIFLGFFLSMAYGIVRILLRPDAGSVGGGTSWDLRNFVPWAQYFMGIGIGIFLVAGSFVVLLNMLVRHAMKMRGL